MECALDPKESVHVAVDKQLSSIFMHITEQQPETNDLVLLTLIANLAVVRNTAGSYGHKVVATGSATEFKIKPFLKFVGDIDIMMSSLGEVAIPKGYGHPSFTFLNNFNEKVALCEFQQTLFPGYVRLFLAGHLLLPAHKLSYTFLPSPAEDGALFPAKGNPVLAADHPSVPSSVNDTKCSTGPAKRANLILTPDFDQELHTSFKPFEYQYDLVYSISCPHWPQEAHDFEIREREFDWPDRKTIREIVEKGCDLVHAPHPYCRYPVDSSQWRLSFSRAEVVLIHTWSPVQQIVYHLLRYVHTHLLTEDDHTVVCSYHLKTLMLWKSEQQPSDYWDSSSLVHITCELLNQLVVHLQKRHLCNYFIPDSNILANCDSSQRMYADVVVKLIRLTNVDELERWFTQVYISEVAESYPPAKSSHLLDMINSALNGNDDFSTRLSVLSDSLLLHFGEARNLKSRRSLDTCAGMIISRLSEEKFDIHRYNKCLAKLPQTDDRLLHLLLATALMQLANEKQLNTLKPKVTTVDLVLHSYSLYHTQNCVCYCHFLKAKECISILINRTDSFKSVLSQAFVKTGQIFKTSETRDIANSSKQRGDASPECCSQSPSSKNRFQEKNMAETSSTNVLLGESRPMVEMRVDQNAKHICGNKNKMKVYSRFNEDTKSTRSFMANDETIAGLHSTSHSSREVQSSVDSSTASGFEMKPEVIQRTHTCCSPKCGCTTPSSSNSNEKLESGIQDTASASTSLFEISNLSGKGETSVTLPPENDTRKCLSECLMKLSLCCMQSFIRSIPCYSDTPQYIQAAAAYEAFYLYKCGAFQTALEKCDAIIEECKKSQQDPYGVTSNLLCLRHFGLLFDDDDVMKEMLSYLYQKMGVRLWMMTPLVVAFYIKTQCMFKLSRPVMDFINTLLSMVSLTVFPNATEIIPALDQHTLQIIHDRILVENKITVKVTKKGET